MSGKSIFNNLQNSFNSTGKLNEETEMSEQLFQFQHENMAWCKSGTRTPGPRDPETRDPRPPQSLTVGQGTPPPKV